MCFLSIHLLVRGRTEESIAASGVSSLCSLPALRRARRELAARD